MKISNTSTRLKKIMTDNNMRQVDILYTESQILNAAHERTDINIPTDIDTSDNDIMDDENF